MANILDTDYKILNPYVSVLLGEKSRREENIKSVVDAFQSVGGKEGKEEKETLYQIVKAYDGDMDMFLQAIYFSEVLSKKKVDPEKKKKKKKAS